MSWMLFSTDFGTRVCDYIPTDPVTILEPPHDVSNLLKIWLSPEFEAPKLSKGTDMLEIYDTVALNTF